MGKELTQREHQAQQLVQMKANAIKVMVGNDKAKASAFAGSLMGMASNYNLKNCSIDSIINCGLEIVRLGLNPNQNLGQAYVVPFKLKNGGETAQLQIGYKGYISLAYRNGWIFRAIAVYNCDEFSLEFAGIKDNITFVPNFNERDESDSNWVFKNLKGVIIYAQDKQENVFSEFVSFKTLEKLRLKSQNQNNKNGLTYIWADWAEDMYKAKALKYVAKRLPINDQMQDAMSAENEILKVDEMPVEVKKEQSIDLNEINKPLEIEVLPHEKLSNELIDRGLTSEEAEKITLKYSKEQVEQILSDPASIESIMEA